MLARDLDTCSRCSETIPQGRSLCTCGKPTRWMSFEERSKYEVEQWRRYREREAEATA